MRNWGDALAHTGPNFGVFEDEPRATISSQAAEQRWGAAYCGEYREASRLATL